VLLNNTGGAPLNAMVTGIRAILDGKAAEMPKQPSAAEIYKTYQASGLQAALKRAGEMKAGSQYDAGEGEMERFAGHLLQTGKAADALTVAKMIAHDSPKSVGAATTLARAEQANGHRVEAVQAWSKAIELSDTPRALLIYTDEIRKLATLDR